MERDFKKLIRILTSLINVYGPISYEELIGKAFMYFREDMSLYTEEEVGFTLEAIEANHMLERVDGDYSAYHQGIIDALRSMPYISTVMISNMEKKFHPSEILLYSDFLNMDGVRSYDELKNYVYGLKKLSDQDKEDLKNEAVTVGIVISELDDFIDKVRRSYHLSKKEASELGSRIERISHTLPRGYFHGYSFEELSTVVTDYSYFINHEFEKISLPYSTIGYEDFSYEDCLELAEEIRETDIFEQISKDNTLEMYFNEQYVYAHMLQHFEGERVIVIFSSNEKMMYNRQFLYAPEDTYPDISFRLEFLEVVLDDPEDFLFGEIEEELEERDLPDCPLFVSAESGSHLAKGEELNLIGGVLSYLLEAYEIVDGDFEGILSESVGDKISQIYLGEDGLQFGRYSYDWLNNPSIPFHVNPLRGNLLQKNKEKKGIYEVGIYAIREDGNTERSYITIAANGENGEIVHNSIHREMKMSNVLNELIESLNALEYYPEEIHSANEFCTCVLRELEEKAGIPVKKMEEPQLSVVNGFYTDYLESYLDSDDEGEYRN